MQHYNVEGPSPWSGEVLCCATSDSIFQREETAIICITYTQIANHAGR
jgi:hypothetical protein